MPVAADRGSPPPAAALALVSLLIAHHPLRDGHGAIIAANRSVPKSDSSLPESDMEHASQATQQATRGLLTCGHTGSEQRSIGGTAGGGLLTTKDAPTLGRFDDAMT